MSSVQLATVSTALWLVAVVALFILLAGWSTGSSWGLTSAIVRGVRGWAERDGRLVPGPSTESLAPILDPYAFVRRGGAQGQPPVDAEWRVEGLEVEIIELGERRLP
jgi:hypothetical protein